METLLVSISHLRNTNILNVSLRLDGEVMAPSRSFQVCKLRLRFVFLKVSFSHKRCTSTVKYYDLEGGELIEVKLVS